jgi:hypothetical protein
MMRPYYSNDPMRDIAQFTANTCVKECEFERADDQWHGRKSLSGWKKEG